MPEKKKGSFSMFALYVTANVMQKTFGQSYVRSFFLTWLISYSICTAAGSFDVPQLIICIIVCPLANTVVKVVISTASETIMEACRTEYILYGKTLEREFGERKKWNENAGKANETEASQNAYRSFERSGYSRSGYNEERANQESVNKAKRDLENALKLYGFSSIANITKEELNKRRIKLVKQYHPDVNPKGEDLIKDVNAAYDLLSRYA